MMGGGELPVSRGVAKRLRVLVLTKIFPNSQNPNGLPHIRRQCQALARHCDLRVLATIPWFPGASLLRRFRYSDEDVAAIPRRETLFGLEVEHPRTLYLPRFQLPSAAAYAASVAREVVRYRDQVDVILSTWVYPDGTAATLLGQLLGIPVVVQVIGSDIDVGIRARSVRAQLRWALPRAAGVIGVSRPLVAECQKLGARPERCRVICTGVDREAFSPQDQGAARRALGIPEGNPLLLYVGRLSAEKGAADALAAFELLRQSQGSVRLAVVGDGPLREMFQHRARELGAALLVPGPVPAEDVPRWMAACDLLTLPSYHEGTPNVVLEALSSGRPVVATRVGGVPDVISAPTYGELVDPGDVTDLAAAFGRVLTTQPDPASIAACPSLRTWDESARHIIDLLQTCVEGHQVVR